MSVSDDQFTECICTVILLEGADLATLVREVLDTRLSAVAQLLTAGGSVRNQLADVSFFCLTCTGFFVFGIFPIWRFAV